MARKRQARRANTNHSAHSQPRQESHILSFFSGLALGLFVAFIVYVREHPPENGNAVSPEILVSQRTESGTPTKQANSAHYDFYTILPEREVKVPDWEIAPPAKATSVQAELEAGTYILQAGSFQRVQQADQARAKLALLGINADIQEVVINGQDVWYRVRVGPFTDFAELESARARMETNKLNFMVLKIRDE